LDPLWKRLAIIGAVSSIGATIFSLYYILNLNFDDESLSAVTLVAIPLVSIAAYGFWLWSALALAKQFNLKRWPLWLMAIHPLFSIFFYWAVNRQALLENRPNPSSGA
jgi:uncharacterized membrane protein